LPPLKTLRPTTTSVLPAGIESGNEDQPHIHQNEFTIQLFSNTQADTSGFGEGEEFLAKINVKTNRKGKRSFTFTVDQDLSGQVITATATNVLTGDTSEFSKAVAAS
jgi:hypothetical protein